MRLLYAPWRNTYLGQEGTPKGCVFCNALAQEQDEKHFIIKRFTYCGVMLNIYPYNAGHILLVPYTHTSQLHNLSLEERSELMEALSISTLLLEKILSCNGINTGINMGKASGGSMPDHLHIHIVPRWWGDTNFLVALADTKHISFDLCALYTTLKEAFDSTT
jgi:ATP adenylyltransferase